MKSITRKEAILKITSLVGKNVEEPKKYEQIVVDEGKIDGLFTEVVLAVDSKG